MWHTESQGERISDHRVLVRSGSRSIGVVSRADAPILAPADITGPLTPRVRLARLRKAHPWVHLKASRFSICPS
jgi:hypothetical protein